ncbi:MAG: potassium channel family protein [Alphaproteobacteria bacterium]|nr:potassium channel family protein [Alphaproteobacteria bacterium]
MLKSLSNNSVKAQLLRLIALLAGLLVLHAAAMVHLEGLSWGDAIWLTLTTVTTVGYGDLAAATHMGRAASVILMYGAGIAVLAQAAALYFEYRQDKRERILNGNWSWDMEDHIVFLNCPKENAARYFYQSILQLRQSAQGVGKKPVLIVSPAFPGGIPDKLRAQDVVHVNQVVTDQQAFVDSSLDKASVIVVLCVDSNDLLSDSLNFDIVSRVREANPKALIIAEAVSDENRARLQKAGADHVVRPIRSYPELLVRTILAPGAEQIIEDLFDSHGEECIKYNVSVSGTWADIAKKIIDEDIGMPLAYANQNGAVISNAHPSCEVSAQAVYVLVREGNTKPDEDVQRLLNGVVKN